MLTCNIISVRPSWFPSPHTVGSQIFHDSILFSQIEFWLLKPSPILYTLCVHTLFVTQSCLTLWNPMNCSPPGSSVYWIFQARILEWVAMPSSRGSSLPRDWIHISYISCIGKWVLYHWRHLGSPVIVIAVIYKDLLSSKHCPEFFAYIIQFGPQHNSMRTVLLPFTY